MDENYSGGNYWDWVSSQDQIDYTDKEGLEELLAQAFSFINPYLNQLFWVESNCIYLNKVYGVPQVEIANYLGISQLGVSKRVRSGIKKLKLKLSLVENDLSTIKRELSYFLDGELLAYAVLLCKTKSVGLAVRLSITYVDISDIIEILTECLNNPNKIIDDRDLQIEAEEVVELCDKYLKFFNLCNELSTIGDCSFKRDDDIKSVDTDIFSVRG